MFAILRRCQLVNQKGLSGMKTAALLFAAVMLGPTTLSAADQFAPRRATVIKTTPTVSPRVVIRRTVRARNPLAVVVSKRPRLFIRTTIGMPCILPPHIQVQRNWPGPQCRYLDNFILLSDVRRYRSVRLFQ